VTHGHPERERAAESKPEHAGMRCVSQGPFPAKLIVNEWLEVVHDEVSHLGYIALRG
jgi:hypothetical protein